MAKIDQRLINGIIATVLILSSAGITYVLNPTGESSGCRVGWIFQESGEYEGMYSCTTGSGTRYEYCYEVTDSSSTVNYRCYIGEPVEIVPDQPDIPVSSEGTQFCCSYEGCVPGGCS